MIYKKWMLFGVCLLLHKQVTFAVNYKVVTIKKDTVDLIQDYMATSIIILSNDNSCRACFRPLNRPEDHLNELLKNRTCNVRFVCRTLANSGSQRRHISQLKLDLPAVANDSNIFFDIYSDPYIYNKQAETGLFGDFLVNQTPAIILYRPGLPLEVFLFDLLYAYLKDTEKFSLSGLIAFREKYK